MHRKIHDAMRDLPSTSRHEHSKKVATAWPGVKPGQAERETGCAAKSSFDELKLDESKVKPIDWLVPVGYTCHHAYTAGLSTW